MLKFEHMCWLLIEYFVSKSWINIIKFTSCNRKPPSIHTISTQSWQKCQLKCIKCVGDLIWIENNISTEMRVENKTQWKRNYHIKCLIAVRKQYLKFIVRHICLYIKMFKYFNNKKNTGLKIIASCAFVHNIIVLESSIWIVLGQCVRNFC